MCAGGRGVQNHIEVNLVLTTFVPAAGVAANTFDLMIGEDVDLASQEALRLRAGALVETVRNVKGEMRLL